MNPEMRAMEEWWAWLELDHHIAMAIALDVCKSPILRKGDFSLGANRRMGYVDKVCLKNFFYDWKDNTISA